MSTWISFQPNLNGILHLIIFMGPRLYLKITLSKQALTQNAHLSHINSLKLKYNLQEAELIS